MDLENFPTSATAKRMLGYVSTEFYEKSYVGKWLYQIMGLEWDDVWEIVNTLPEQLFPETATWGLMYHEMKYKLPIRSNLSYAERRRIIFEKRDVRKPMNPWMMEQIVYGMTGRTGHVLDSMDDSSIPANTFVVKVDAGEGGLDIGALAKKLREVKQSHVTFSVKVYCRASLKIGTSRGIWKTKAVTAGTKPKVSRGLSLSPSGIDLMTSEERIANRYPMAGTSDSTGSYPIPSRISELRAQEIEMRPQSLAIPNTYPMTGDSLAAGTKPRQSRGMAESPENLNIKASSKSYKIRSVSTGTKPRLSNGVAEVHENMNIKTSSEIYKIKRTPTGADPVLSRAADLNSDAVSPSVSTAVFSVRSNICGRSGL